MAYTYHVVEFEKIPYEGVAKFACIPNAWVQPIKTKTNNEVMVTYPGQNEPDIDHLVRNNSECANTATWYKAHLRHSTDTYERAKEIEQELNLPETMAELGIKEEARTPSTPTTSSNVSNNRQSTDMPSTPQTPKLVALANIPGYDKNDYKCKWTLKYPNQPKVDGYIALRPKKPRNVKVFVSVDELNACSDPTGIYELATDLLTVVFKKEALAHCTFYKDKSTAFLNENAKGQIKEYIEEVASEHEEWHCPVDYVMDEMNKAFKSLKKSLRNNKP